MLIIEAFVLLQAPDQSIKEPQSDHPCVYLDGSTEPWCEGLQSADVV